MESSEVPLIWGNTDGFPLYSPRLIQEITYDVCHSACDNFIPQPQLVAKNLLWKMTILQIEDYTRFVEFIWIKQGTVSALNRPRSKFHSWKAKRGSDFRVGQFQFK